MAGSVTLILDRSSSVSAATTTQTKNAPRWGMAGVETEALMVENRSALSERRHNDPGDGSVLHRLVGVLNVGESDLLRDQAVELDPALEVEVDVERNVPPGYARAHLDADDALLL